MYEPSQFFSMVNFLTALVLAGWIIVVAILAVQNAAPVALKFLVFQSIQIPIGVVLAFSIAIGAVGMGLLQLLWGIFSSKATEEDLDPGEDLT